MAYAGAGSAPDGRRAEPDRSSAQLTNPGSDVLVEGGGEAGGVGDDEAAEAVVRHVLGLGLDRAGVLERDEVLLRRLE